MDFLQRLFKLEGKSTMNLGMRLDIQWATYRPHTKFITFGPEVTLYEVAPTSDGAVNPLVNRISETQYAKVIHVTPNPQYLKCIAWHPLPSFENLVAAGLANGRVILTRLAPGKLPENLLGREFLPRHPRQCNCIEWSYGESNIFVAGLDKAKTDHSILIWDLLKSGAKQESDKRLLGAMNSESNLQYTRPIVEMGHAETVHSLKWLPRQTNAIVAGMSNKYLKIFDMRDPGKHQNISPTKSVYGIAVDPDYEWRLASFSESHIVLWDIRSFEKPVIAFPETRVTTKIEWCPTRSNLLAAVGRESNSLKLLDVQHVSSNTEEAELPLFERSLLPFDEEQIASFAWHPKDENRMLLLSPLGAFRDFTVFERITVRWSPCERLVWTEGKFGLKDAEEIQNKLKLDDVFMMMKLRALEGYGVRTFETKAKATSVGNIGPIWAWIEMVKKMQEEGVFASWSRDFKFQGVRDIICSGKLSNGSGTNTKSEIVNQVWPNLSTPNASVTTKTYCSKDRDNALQLCGWGCDRDGHHLTQLLEKLEREGAIERAAAIAIFNLQLCRAIETLKKGALNEQFQSNTESSVLNLVAMAVSGYTAEKSALWRQMCQLLYLQLQHPYLRAIFSFLTFDEENYGEVLNEYGLAIQDQIGFACWFLPDAKLSDYINKLTHKMISRGNLEGILLTGLLDDGLDLLQHYVDKTGDVQTPCLIVMNASPNAISEDPKVLEWIESYRSALDQWQLWHARANFDVQWNKVSKAIRPQHNVYISCNFCGKSISSYMGTQSAIAMPKGTHPGTFANKTKMTSCRGCMKPLPRCAICLVHMGTAAGIVKTGGKSSSNRLTKFSSWFTWCQTCRHGGHANHILEWFKEQNECPVTGCTCKCMSLDSES